MRRHGNLWPQIIAPENIAEAFRKSALNKGWMRAVKEFRKNLDANLDRVRIALADKTFTTSPYVVHKIYEPKERDIYVLPLSPDRIVQHALMNVVSPIWERLFIRDSYACIVGRGIHAGSRKTMEYVRRNKYVLKCDVAKFYPSIDHDILMGIVRRKIKCRDTLWLIEKIIYSFPGGKNVPIGNYTSQWFGNLYMNELDRHVKEQLHVRDYVRYCDDFCLFSNDKSFLHDCRRSVSAFALDRLKLTLRIADVFPVSRGVDFLGYRHFNNYILLRKSTAKRVRHRLALLPGLFAKGRITKEQFRSSVASTHGWLKHANSKNFSGAVELEFLKKQVAGL